MHYGKQSFSKNGKPTLLAINNPQMSLGQRQHLSTEDVIQLNALYKCKGKDWMNHAQIERHGKLQNHTILRIIVS